MTWFKVDDGFHKHRKRVRAGLTIEGLAAIGLWTIAGSWSADELTDGFVPDDVMDYLAPSLGQDLAKRLESARLWHRSAEGLLVPPAHAGGQSDEPGWQFHQWEGHQPTREQVLAERAAAAERQRRARDKAREVRGNQGQNDTGSRRDSHVTHGGSHGGVTPAVTGPPSRPVPSRPDPTSSPPSPSSRQQLADYGLTERETTKTLELLHASVTVGNEDALVRKLIDNGDIDRWIDKMRAALDDDTPRHRLPAHDFQPDASGRTCHHDGCGMLRPHANHKTPVTVGADA